MTDISHIKLLVVETSGEPCSAAVYAEGCLRVKTEADTSQRSRNVLAMAAGLLEETALLPSQLDGIAWSAGPGSFTGLRMGASICQAIAFAQQLPILSVSSLKLLAQAVVNLVDRPDDLHIAVAVDARMGEIYWASFICKGGNLHYLDEDQVLQADPAVVAAKLAKNDGEWLLAGDGWRLTGIDAGQYHWIDTSRDLAGALVSLALKSSREDWSTEPDVCVPRYLRGATQWKKRERF